jgi:nitrosocyanin
MGKMVIRNLLLVAAIGAVALLSGASRTGAQEAPAAPAIKVAPAAPANPLLEKVNGVRKFTLDSVLLGETKFWLPSTIVVEQGDQVELTLKNEVPGVQNNQHGFAIPAYNIATVVTAGKPQKVAFTADKPGIFVFGCQLHPAHVGGQLIVRARSS